MPRPKTQLTTTTTPFFYKLSAHIPKHTIRPIPSPANSGRGGRAQIYTSQRPRTRRLAALHPTTGLLPAACCLSLVLFVFTWKKDNQSPRAARGVDSEYVVSRSALYQIIVRWSKQSTNQLVAQSSESSHNKASHLTGRSILAPVIAAATNAAARRRAVPSARPVGCCRSGFADRCVRAGPSM